MLFPSFTMGPKSVSAYLNWHPDREEVQAARDYALDETACSIPYGGPWICPTCRTRVPGEAVTFEETHDERCGGCGQPVC